MEKLDLKRTRPELFTAPLNQFVSVTCREVWYLMADGHGDPNRAPEYQRAVESLFVTAYAIKFACKAEGKDFVVLPLEGLWSAPDPESFVEAKKDDWDWTMMIMVPDFVDQNVFAAGKLVSERKLSNLSSSLRLERMREGVSLQALHVGSYDDEGPLLAKLHREIMPSGGYDFNGPHHEVYLSDPRRTQPGKLKTLLRQPVRAL